jgi:hypothetical protein
MGQTIVSSIGLGQIRAFLGSLIGHGLSTARSHDCSSFIRKILSSRVETPQSGRLNTWLCGKVRLFNLSHPVA